MGQTLRVANALPKNSGYLKVYGSRTVLQATEQQIDWGVEANASAEAHNAKISVSGKYGRSTKLVARNYDWEETIEPGCTREIKLDKHCEYISMMLVLGGRIEVTIFLNRSLGQYSSYAGFVIYSLDGSIRTGELLKGNHFRMVAKNADANPRRNYPPGYDCN